ncbi:hypothetical protein BH18ACT15_BH18ACT15_13440 [soil metagenome]
MDATEVTAAAEDHASGVVAGDLRRAGSYLSPEARAGAADVMKRMPDSLTSAQVTSVATHGEGWTVVIEYSGRTGQAIVSSLWAERDGKPRIVGFEEAV